MVKISKKLMMSTLAAFMVFGAAGCSSSGTSSSTGTENTTDTNDAKVTVVEVSGPFDTVPEDYPFIAGDDFVAAFDVFHEKASKTDATSMTYDDIVEIFGAPGAYYVDQDYNDGQYKYYKWFSDDDKDVLITFKGDNMTYFAWTSSTVSAN